MIVAVNPALETRRPGIQSGESMGFEEIGDPVPVQLADVPGADQDVDPAIPFEKQVQAESLQSGGEARRPFDADDLILFGQRGAGRETGEAAEDSENDAKGDNPQHFLHEMPLFSRHAAITDEIILRLRKK